MTNMMSEPLPPLTDCWAQGSVPVRCLERIATVVEEPEERGTEETGLEENVEEEGTDFQKNERGS